MARLQFNSKVQIKLNIDYTNANELQFLQAHSNVWLKTHLDFEVIAFLRSAIRLLPPDNCRNDARTSRQNKREHRPANAKKTECFISVVRILTVDGRGEMGEGEEVVELPQLRRRPDGGHVVRLRYRRRRGGLAADGAMGPGRGGRGRRRGTAVLGRPVLGGAVPGLGERGGAGEDVQQPADVRLRLLRRRVLLCRQAVGNGIKLEPTCPVGWLCRC